MEDPGPNNLLASQLSEQARKRKASRDVSSNQLQVSQPDPISPLASARAVLILLPALVLCVGMALLYIGQSALSSTSRSMAGQRFRQQTESASQRIGDALHHAEPVLDRLATLSRTEAVKASANDTNQLRPLALDLRDLVRGRPGLTQAYIAWPNGKFISADSNEQDIVEFQVTSAGLSHRYRFRGLQLEPVDVEESDYDPTQRSWYELARRSPGRAWSDPYSFWFNGNPGVTRVQSLRGPDGELEAVVGVDFDVDALTRFMARAETQQVHSVVFTAQGVVLAYPKGQAAMQSLQSKRSGRGGSRPVATYEQLQDPILDGLFEALRRRKGTSEPSSQAASIPGGFRYLRYQAGDETILAAVRPMAEDGPPWFVATLSPEASVLSPLRTYRTRSLVVAGLALSVAVLVAWVFARHIVSARREAVRARAEARRAQQRMRDLGSYRLVERIGQGGMGEVWQARHHLLARQAAIKLIRTNVFEGAKRSEMERRFRREAQAIAGLRSRNTIELFDYGTTDDGTLYYAMELLDGIDMQSLVERFGPQNPERVRQILIQACNSLSEAHDAELVHRDVKPANVFLCRAADEVDVVKLLDFGLVLSPLSAGHADEKRSPPELPERPEWPAPKSVLDESLLQLESRLTQVDVQLGTPGFMSPEQALGASIDGRADLYSLACVAWWLLTAQLPFRGETPLGTMLKHIQAPLPDVDELLEQPLSREFRTLLEQCLEKSVEDRPQNARELAECLRDMGPQSEAWAQQSAIEWWRRHMPPRPSSSAHQSLRPPEAVHVISHPGEMHNETLDAPPEPQEHDAVDNEDVEPAQHAAENSS